MSLTKKSLRLVPAVKSGGFRLGTARERIAIMLGAGILATMVVIGALAGIALHLGGTP